MIKRFHGSARAAAIIVTGRQVETSGLVAQINDPEDIRSQTLSVLSQAEALFNEAGLSKENITRVQIWLADMADFSAMNEIYDNWVSSFSPPTRACVGAALADNHYKIEIQVFGYIGS